jgi:hypothetical protein
VTTREVHRKLKYQLKSLIKDQNQRRPSGSTLEQSITTKETIKIWPRTSRK